MFLLGDTTYQLSPENAFLGCSSELLVTVFCASAICFMSSDFTTCHQGQPLLKISPNPVDFC
jgi:hypothetical protein